MTYLGLDCSTTVCGWTVLNDDTSFDSVGYLDFKKFEDLYDKADYFVEFLRDLTQKKNITKVFIESPAMVYSTSTAQIISLLQRFSGIISYSIWNTTGIKPVLISSHESRKACGIKVPRGCDTKQFIWENIKARNVIPEELWIFKKTGRPKDFCYDMADSYVVALGGISIYGNK